MISSVLAVAMAAYMQPADSTRASREAFTTCLRTYVERAANSHTSAADFATAYPQQCTAQETAFRNAVISREVASRASRADATESAGLEIEDARTNFSERFSMYATPAPGGQTQTAAAPAPAATPGATPAATPASAAAPAANATPAATPAAQTTAPH